MKFTTLILGYVIIFRTFEVKHIGIEWILTVIAMSLAFYSGYTTKK